MSRMIWKCLVLCMMLCCGEGKVKIFGDSILASNTPIQNDLETLSGEKMDNHASIGSGLRDGWIASIPFYYDLYKYPIANTVIMDGGGNDVNGFRNDCIAFNENCRKQLDGLVDILDGLFKQMKEDGVKNIIYVGFYYIGRLNNAIDYGMGQLYKKCLPKNNCYIVDLRNATIPLGWDGLHPNVNGYHTIASQIWHTKESLHIPF